MDKLSDVTHIQQLLLQKDLWLKKSSEGANSLFRAISVCLYFTERYEEVIRKLVISFFYQGYAPSFKNEIQLKMKDRYLQNVSLFEFEPLNLEIISCLFNVEINMFYLQDQQLKVDCYKPESQLHIKLVRISEMNYAALFSRPQKEIYSFVQNIVLSLVEIGRAFV